MSSYFVFRSFPYYCNGTLWQNPLNRYKKGTVNSDRIRSNRLNVIWHNKEKSESKSNFLWHIKFLLLREWKKQRCSSFVNFFASWNVKRSTSLFEMHLKYSVIKVRKSNRTHWNFMSNIRFATNFVCYIQWEISYERWGRSITQNRILLIRSLCYARLLLLFRTEMWRGDLHLLSARKGKKKRRRKLRTYCLQSFSLFLRFFITRNFVTYYVNFFISYSNCKDLQISLL